MRGPREGARCRPRRTGRGALSSLALSSVGDVEPAIDRKEAVEEVDDVGVLSESVSVSVASLPSRNLRELKASTRINAPAGLVWDTLTSYETLHEFIPGLAVNECLERVE